MKTDEKEMKKEVQNAPSHLTPNEKVDEAVKSVYQKYGTDLSRFFRDAYEATAPERKNETSDDALEVCA